MATEKQLDLAIWLVGQSYQANFFEVTALINIADEKLTDLTARHFAISVLVNRSKQLPYLHFEKQAHKDMSWIITAFKLMGEMNNNLNKAA